MRRFLALLFVLALTATACGGESDNATETGIGDLTGDVGDEADPQSDEEPEPEEEPEP